MCAQPSRESAMRAPLRITWLQQGIGHECERWETDAAGPSASLPFHPTARGLLHAIHPSLAPRKLLELENSA